VGLPNKENIVKHPNAIRKIDILGLQETELEKFFNNFNLLLFLSKIKTTCTINTASLKVKK
jgi:hypothetical protein